MNQNISHPKKAVIITIFLIVLLLSSLAALLLPHRSQSGYTADIYQNGTLIMSIPLNEVTETYTFSIEGENGCINEVEVRPGSIAIVSADCPDKLCVNQGFISDSRLPITCLPNRLVIQLRPASDTAKDSKGDLVIPDIITY